MSENALIEASSRVLENLAELEPELVNAGIFDSGRAPIAITSSAKSWSKEAVGLLESLEAGSGEERFDSAHIAAASGEVFVVSEDGLYLVAVTGRYVLASLTAYDMRMALRDAVRIGSASQADPTTQRRKTTSEAEKRGPEDA